jgi:hypothetical protein
LKSLVKRLPVSLLTGFLLILALFSCTKDPYELGIDLLPPSDTLNVLLTDTITVEAFSVIQDSIRTDETSYIVLGSINDPIFGKTTAGLYTQFRLSSEEVDFGDNPVLDSLVLVLYYNDYYGDTTTQQNIKVYEISEDLKLDSVYFSNQHKATYGTLLANHDFYPRPTDSVTVNGSKTPAHLRINLTKMGSYLGNKILQAPASALENNNAFVSYMKGLYIASSPVAYNGALLNFSVNNGLTRLALYFHEQADTAKDSLYYDLPINENAARFSHLDHNNYLDASQDLKRQILNHDSAQGVNQVFLQGLGGVKIKLKFPYLENFGKGKLIAVNDALLTFKNMENDTILSPPPKLTLIRQDSAGRIGYLIDESEGSAYFGGTYNATTRTYQFRITRHVQKILQDYYSSKFDLYILVNNPTVSALVPNRVKLVGTNPENPAYAADRFQLKMIYTLLH